MEGILEYCAVVAVGWLLLIGSRTPRGIRLIRRLRRIAPATVTRDQALEIARAECERRGYGWLGPVKVEESLKEYWLLSQADRLEGSVSVTVDVHTGEIKNVTLIPYRSPGHS